MEPQTAQAWWTSVVSPSRRYTAVLRAGACTSAAGAGINLHVDGLKARLKEVEGAADSVRPAEFDLAAHDPSAQVLVKQVVLQQRVKDGQASVRIGPTDEAGAVAGGVAVAAEPVFAVLQQTIATKALIQRTLVQRACRLQVRNLLLAAGCFGSAGEHPERGLILELPAVFTAADAPQWLSSGCR
jgi:hypothetical protein